ncbi:hypothetical protein Mapa_002549 [Marchantia paleacea]|nr:hypothetical protein Mapa_002549 [Marchantia paleacea]
MLPLKPIRFYGSALPRPRIHEDVKHSDSRVDPPLGINDSLLRWAANAHWSMGGTSFKRHRMQGKIEGRLKKLRDEKEEGESSSDDEPPAPKKISKARKVFKPSVAMKLDSGKSRNKENSPPAKRRLTRDSPQSPSVVMKNSRLSQATPAVPLRVSPRHQAIQTPSKGTVSPPSSFATLGSSPEFPVIRRRQVESALQASEESDSDGNFEEFSRIAPLRRSSRVTAIRRSFKDLVPLTS